MQDHKYWEAQYEDPQPMARGISLRAYDAPQTFGGNQI